MSIKGFVEECATTSTAVVPDPGSSFASSKPHNIKDIDPHTAQGPPATKKEVWSYYAYYAGNNGIGSFQYSNLLFQNLIYQGGFNPNILPLGSASCDVDPTAPCHVFWGGGTKEYTSVILIGNGLTFLAQALLFVGIGSLADFGNWNPWVVRGFSVLCWAFEFGFLGVTKANQWHTAMGLYILSSTSSQFARSTPLTYTKALPFGPPTSSSTLYFQRSHTTYQKLDWPERSFCKDQ